MNILLLSMPDSFEHTPSLAIRMPNGALASLAGNVDPHHQRRRRRSRPRAVLRPADGRAPGRGYSARRRRAVGHDVPARHRAPNHRARPIAEAGRADRRRRLRSRAWRRRHGPHPRLGVDVIVRGEGDMTFRELLRALEEGRTARRHRRPLVSRGRSFRRNPSRRDREPRSRRDIRPPNRAARVLSGYTMLGRPIDVVETSRGCTFDCSFCSIIEMRGRNFHRFPDRARHRRHRATRAARGARSIFIVDDNITLDVPRFEALCRAIVARRAERHRLPRAGDDGVRLPRTASGWRR